MEELKEIITCALDKRGVLSKLKAELRANIFLAVDEQDRRSGDGGIAARSDASKRDALAATREGALALALVRELLAWADCRFSAKVLEAEVGYGSAAPAPLERARLAEELGLSAAATEDQPLLVPVLLQALAGAGRPARALNSDADSDGGAKGAQPSQQQQQHSADDDATTNSASCDDDAGSGSDSGDDAETVPVPADLSSHAAAASWAGARATDRAGAGISSGSDDGEASSVGNAGFGAGESPLARLSERSALLVSPGSSPDVRRGGGGVVGAIGGAASDAESDAASADEVGASPDGSPAPARAAPPPQPLRPAGRLAPLPALQPAAAPTAAPARNDDDDESAGSLPEELPLLADGEGDDEDGWPFDPLAPAPQPLRPAAAAATSFSHEADAAFAPQARAAGLSTFLSDGSGDGSHSDDDDGSG